MKKTRIAIIGPAYPYRGGQALVEAHLYHLLTSGGYDCFTITYTLLYPSIFFPGRTQFDRSGKVYFEHNHKIFRLINSINPFSWLRAVKKIFQSKPEVIVIIWWMPFFGPCLSTIAWLSKKLFSTQIVFLVENYISHENRWFDRFLTKMTFQCADHIIVQSDYIKKRYIERDYPSTPAHKTTVPVFECFDEKRYTQDLSRQELGITTKNVVLFFGYIRPYKGLKNLLRCFQQVLEKNPDTTLLIVGEYYEDQEIYNRLIKDEKIENHTLVVSKYVPNEEVEIYFKATDVTCMPYDSATQSGILMLSYGFRKPVVVTDVAGLPEFVVHDKTGVVVPKNDLKRLAGGINRILVRKDDFDFAEYIGQHVLELGNKNLIKVFEQIVSKNQQDCP